jgi:hypothetical protein
MKILKKIVIALLVIIAIPLIAALFVSKDFQSEREIVINKPKQEVFDYIRFIKNQENFGVWYRMDPEMKKQYEGTDGTVGFTYTWDGPKMGKGKQVLTNVVEGDRIESDLFFMESKDAANAYLSVAEKSANETLVKWVISGKTPYPWNLMSLFFDMGKDFDEGLKNLKEVLEKNPSPEKTTVMKKLQFKIAINAPAEKVYKIMLGIDDIKNYEQWTSLFNATSTYKGSWEKGSKIYFIGTDDKGKQGGMVSEIAENVPNKFVSIRHYGILEGEMEIVEGPEVEKWANGFENYTFEENNGVTTVTVDLDTTEEFVGFMNSTYPKAMEKLKEISEKKS